MKRKNKTQTKKIQMTHLLSRPHLWIGISTVLLVVLLAVKFIPFHSIKKNMVCQGLIEKKLHKKSASKTVENKDSLTKKESTYIVRENDNFWKISVKNCGTGTYYLGIQRRNGYDNNWKALHTGEKISILCEE